MPRWFNPRVFAVAISIVVLALISTVGESRPTIFRAWVICGGLLLLYAWAFLLPLWRTLGSPYVAGPAVMLCAAWIAVALALTADALPRTLAQRMEHRFNWPMAAFCVAGSAAFTLFFQSVSRSLRLREDVLEARNSRD